MPCTGDSSFRFIFENLYSVPCVCKPFGRKGAGIRAHQETAVTAPAAIWVCFICIWADLERDASDSASADQRVAGNPTTALYFDTVLHSEVNEHHPCPPRPPSTNDSEEVKTVTDR
jgi:hypothetical protein